MNRYIALIASLFIVFAMNYCGGKKSSGKDYPRFSSDNNEIISFSFTATLNSQLGGDVSGVITDSNIAVEVPHSVNISSLVAEFVTNSSDVKVNGTVQVSGETANDFSGVVEYSVAADSGDLRVYRVTVTKAPSDEKSLTSFSINGIAGVIDEASGTVSVSLPPKSTVTSLKSIFETAGASVTINGTEQISGVTENNFSSPLTYRVSAEDGSVKDYTVTVTVLKDTAKDILSFGFKKSDNPLLSGDVYGVITGSEIAVELPYGSSRENLKAVFETTGESVSIGTAPQESGVSVNSFNDTVEYKVTAEDSSSRVYSVAVTVAKSDAKEITRFTLEGEEGVIDQDSGTVTLEFPADRDLSSAVAEFVSTGVSVMVNGTEQQTGVTANNFTSEVIYTVTADNGTARVYTVKISRPETLESLLNFETGTDGSYTVSGAEYVEGLTGGAVFFEAGDYILIPDSDSLTLAESGTIEVLLNAVTHQPYAGVVHKGVKKDFSDETYSLQFWGVNGTDGTMRFSIFNASGEYAYVESETKLATGTWYYAVATWDQSEIRIYINGKLEESIPNTIGQVRDSDAGVVIGAQLPVKYSTTWSNLVFNGTIDRVVIHSRALTEDEIAENFSGFPIGQESSLTAFIIRGAKNHYPAIGILFVLLVLLLTGISIYNRRRRIMLY